MAPYWGTTFWTFFLTLFGRLPALLTGYVSMASDEIQIVSLCLLSIITSMVGVFLVVRKMTMVANAITHTSLLGIVLVVIASYFITGNDIGVMSSQLTFWHLMGGATLTSVLTMSLIELLAKKLNVQLDVSIGLVFTFMFALGVIIATIFTRSSHVGIEIITGNIDLMTIYDLGRLVILAFFIGGSLLLFWKPLIISSFDGQFAKVSGLWVKTLNYFVVFLTALSVIVAMRAVGVVLVLAMLVVPVITARQLFSSMKKVTICSIAIGVAASIFSVAVSRHCLSEQGVALSTAGLVVFFLTLIWGGATLFKFVKTSSRFARKEKKPSLTVYQD